MQRVYVPWVHCGVNLHILAKLSSGYDSQFSRETQLLWPAAVYIKQFTQNGDGGDGWLRGGGGGG